MGKPTFAVFIAHRVNDVVNSLFYVLTNQNVADNLARYEGFNNLTKRSRWCIAPDFLHKEVA